MQFFKIFNFILFQIKLLHADFYELHDDKPVTMDIPVDLSGSAPGVLNSGGGILSRNKRKLKS